MLPAGQEIRTRPFQLVTGRTWKGSVPRRCRRRHLTRCGAGTTDLANTLKGSFFYLYLIMDVFSRKIVGWEVFEQESAEHAAAVFTAAHQGEGVPCHTLVLHSDNGTPMKGVTMLATLQRLGVVLRNWEPVTVVLLNPGKPLKQEPQPTPKTA